MPANVENLAVATGLEKVSFHSSPKERQCQGMLKLLLPYNCAHLHADKIISKSFKPGFNSTRTKNFQMCKLDLEKAEEPEIKLPTNDESQKKQGNSKKHLLLLHWTMLKPLDHNTLQNITKEMGISDHIICLLRNLYAGQEATVRTRHRTTDWFKIGKEVHKDCILSPCLFNLYAEFSLVQSLSRV